MSDITESESEDKSVPRQLNKYRCPQCRTPWTDIYRAQPEMECPKCGLRHITPYSSKQLGEDEDLDDKTWDDMTTDELDEEVHDLKAKEAADINNGGREIQLDYLNGYGGLASRPVPYTVIGHYEDTAQVFCETVRAKSPEHAMGIVAKKISLTADVQNLVIVCAIQGDVSIIPPCEDSGKSAMADDMIEFANDWQPEHGSEEETALINKMEKDMKPPAVRYCKSCGNQGDTEDSIQCTECKKWFCDNCYNCELGDGCKCHPSNTVATVADKVAPTKKSSAVGAYMSILSASTGLRMDPEEGQRPEDADNAAEEEKDQEARQEQAAVAQDQKTVRNDKIHALIVEAEAKQKAPPAPESKTPGPCCVCREMCTDSQKEWMQHRKTGKILQIHQDCADLIGGLADTDDLQEQLDNLEGLIQEQEKRIDTLVQELGNIHA